MQSEHRRVESGPEAGPRGFTAINITPPQSRGTLEQRTSATDRTNTAVSASSTTSPEIHVSPQHSNMSSVQSFGNESSAKNLKRRRSVSSDQGSLSPRRYEQHPSRNIDPRSQQMADRALHVLDSANGHVQHSYYPPSETERQSRPYEQSPYAAQNAAHPSPPESRPSEAYSTGSGEQLYPGTDDARDQQQAMQPGQKRKRNFSNRTKTGCITCRHRKKKCDEGRPFCNNCIRGGFNCAGYQSTRGSTWTKPTPQGKPVPLQSKEDGDVAPYENNITPVSANSSSDLRSALSNSTQNQPRPSIEGTPTPSRPHMATEGHDTSRPQYGPHATSPSDSQRPYSGPQHHHHQQQQQQQPPPPPPPPSSQQQSSQWPQHNSSTAPPASNTLQPPAAHHHQAPYNQENLPSLSEVSRSDQQHLANQQQHQQPASQSSVHPSQQPPPQSQQQQGPPPPPLPPSSAQQPQQRQDYSSTPHRDMARPQTQAQSAGPVSGPPPQWQQQPPPPQTTPTQQSQPQPQGPAASQHQSHAQPAQPQHPHPHPHQHPHQQQYTSQPQQEYGSRPNPYPPRIDTNQPHYSQSNPRMNTANTASASYSSYEAKAGSKLFTTEDVERSRMLRGANYNYFDKTLHNERQRCANALLRYNNACQLGSGVSDQELQNMLLKVFIPKRDQTHSFLAANTLEGSLGPGVKIEPGFRCTYGYNLRIYDNVFIGEHTRIDDSARVEIGSRTWIGANVTILTNDVNKETQNRKGTDGQPCVAHGVYIGSEVVIGTGAVILPGRKLGKGSTVEPFAVVKNDLADYETQKVYEGPRMGMGLMSGYGGMMG